MDGKEARMEPEAVKVEDLQIKREPDLQRDSCSLLSDDLETQMEHGTINEEDEEIMPPLAIFIKSEPGDDEEDLVDPLEEDTRIPPDEQCAATSVDKFFTSRSGHRALLVTHMKTNPVRAEEHASERRLFNERTFECNDCNKKYLSKMSLIKHLRVHDKNNPFPCTMCNSSFLYKSVLELHMQEHIREMPYKCSVCSNRYSDKESLNAHMKTHRGEKHFECLYCDKKFTRKSNYKQHLFVHNIKKMFDYDVQ